MGLLNWLKNKFKKEEELEDLTNSPIMEAINIALMEGKPVLVHLDVTGTIVIEVLEGEEDKHEADQGFH